MTQLDTATLPTDSASKHIDRVFEAASSAMSATCGLNPQRVEQPSEQSETLILGIISLIGEVEWSLFLGLPKETAVRAAAKFAGFEIPFESPDMGDAVGELTNIFAGQLKQLLDNAGVKANISLPSVLRADNIQVLIQRQSASKRVCFESEIGKFWAGVLVGTASGLAA